MNLLFINTFKVSSTKGGTERASVTVASFLKKIYGYKSYSVYHEEADSPKENCFEDTAFITTKEEDTELPSILRRWKIDFIIIQGIFGEPQHIRKILSTNKLDVIKIIFCHHFAPGWELNYYSRQIYFNHFLAANAMTEKIKNLIKFFLGPVAIRRNAMHLHKNYTLAYENSDKVVLLSPSYKSTYKLFANLAEDGKMTYIPNAVTFENWLDKDDIKKKQNIVLIVSRLDENQKRISIALSLWNELYQSGINKDWKLIIVGYGEDGKQYKYYVTKHHLDNVEFVGRQKSYPYYVKSKIFMMTSKSEGLPLTVTEAKQQGCVPLAFNTFSSVYDIIEDGKDGFVINEGDRKTYLQDMKLLFSDNDTWERMSECAIDTSKKLSLENVAEKWHNLLVGLVDDKAT